MMHLLAKGTQEGTGNLLSPLHWAGRQRFSEKQDLFQSSWKPGYLDGMLRVGYIQNTEPSANTIMSHQFASGVFFSDGLLMPSLCKNQLCTKYDQQARWLSLNGSLRFHP